MSLQPKRALLDSSRLGTLTDRLDRVFASETRLLQVFSWQIEVDFGTMGAFRTLRLELQFVGGQNVWRENG